MSKFFNQTFLNRFLIVVVLFLVVQVVALTKQVDVLKSDVNSSYDVKLRLESLEKASSVNDKNISKLFRNDSLIVVRQDNFADYQQKQSFISFLLKAVTL